MNNSHILVIDDTTANLDLMEEILAKHGYIVSALPDGQRALKWVQKKTPDLILLDINMPDIDGYEVCQALKQKESTKNIPIIFISALGETVDKIKAFSVGGIDYITKPLQAEEMLVRVQTHLTLRKLQQELEQSNECLHENNVQLRQEIENRKRAEKEVEQSKIQLINQAQELVQANEKLSEAMSELWGEMTLAKKIQTVLIPTHPKMEGFDVCATLNPMDEVGGDYYDVINIEGYDWLVIGDVSGHGVSAGLIMMMVQTAIHTVLLENPTVDPAKLLTIVNKVIYDNIKKMGEDKYMTIMVLAYKSKEQTFYYSGLHEDIIIYRSEKKSVEKISTEGMWIGIVPDISSMVSTQSCCLATNDVMLLYTDGVIEAMNDADEQFDNSGLIDILEQHGEKSAAEILNTIINKLKYYKVMDDVALLVVKA